MTSTKVKQAFSSEVENVPLARILPSKVLTDAMRATSKYGKIKASIGEVGLVEPLVVHKQVNGSEEGAQYVLLDGHMRFDVLKESGAVEAACLLSTDDERYTYNRHVNRLSAIQEHVMIVRALRDGVDEERLARTLNIDMAKLREKKTVINGICADAVELLKEKPITPKALRVMKRVKGLRQIEMAELMISANNYTTPYAQALYLATPEDELVDSKKEKETNGVKPADISRMEKEMEGLERDMKEAEETYAQNVLKLVLARGYLRKILENGHVVRYLSKNFPEIHEELTKIVESDKLEG